MITLRNNGLHTVEQAPEAAMDYGVNWVPQLKEGEVITTSTWTSTQGTSLFSEQQNLAGVTTTFVTLAKNLDGKEVTIKNAIVTNQGRKDSRVLVIVCTPQ